MSRIAVLLGLSLLLAACSSSPLAKSDVGGDGESSPNDETNGAPGDESTGANPDGGGGGKDGGGPGSNPTPVANHVVVQVTSQQIYGGFFQTPAPPSGPIPGCRTVTAGPCEIVSDCDAATIDPADRWRRQREGDCVNGGELTVDGPFKSTISYGAGDYYAVAFGTPLYSPGANVRFRGAGYKFEGIPAFDATLTAPQTVTLTKPTVVEGSTPGFATPDTTVPQVFEWTGGSSGKISFLFSARSLQGDAVFARCTYDISANQGSVPASVLATVKSYNNVAQMQYDFETSIVKRVDDWDVYLSIHDFSPGYNQYFQ